MFLVAVPNESTTPCVEIVKNLYAVNGYDVSMYNADRVKMLQSKP